MRAESAAPDISGPVGVAATTKNPRNNKNHCFSPCDDIEHRGMPACALRPVRSLVFPPKSASGAIFQLTALSHMIEFRRI
jgi:hypothetical protein